MRNWTKAVLPLALAMTASGCSAEITSGEKDGKQAVAVGPTVTQTSDLKGFTGVEVSGPDDVTIRQGAGFGISWQGPKEEIDELEIKLDGDMLSIGRKRSGFSFGGRDHEGVQITITMPKLRSVRLTGSGSIDADNVDGDTVEAVVTGSGDLKIAKLTGKSAEVAVSGSGDIEIGGGTTTAGEYSVTGSGDIDADGLVAQTLDVSITGSGNIDGHATGKVDVNILGSGDVKIGGGATCTTKQMGSGTATCN